MISTRIEIDSPPAVVKAVLLDFAIYREWHNGYVKSITPHAPTKAPEQGDKLDCVMEGFKFTSVVVENSDSAFVWQGPPVYGVIAGLHTFRFDPSKTTIGGTTFQQNEEYSGLLSFVMNPSLPPGKKIKGQFEEFNQGIKARAEAMKQRA